MWLFSRRPGPRFSGLSTYPLPFLFAFSILKQNKQTNLFLKTAGQKWPAVNTPLKVPTVSPASLHVLTHSQLGWGSARF